MPIHDWSKVNAGTFHHFHNAWNVRLSDALNDGLLPEGFYAMTEQHAGKVIADVLTLPADDGTSLTPGGPAVKAVAEAPPRVSRKMIASPNAAYRIMRRSLAIRHVSNHRLIALLEILSPANKDRTASVDDFVKKAHAALRAGCHLLIIDLFAPGRYDPHGIHAAIWEAFDADADFGLPAGKPLTLAAYLAATVPEAFVEPVAVGDALLDMPLFLDLGCYVNVPLEATYSAAYRGVPAYWRGVLEKP